MATISSWTHPFKSYLELHPSANIGCMFRSFIHSEIGLEHCLQNLPARFVAEFRALNSRGRATQEQGDLEAAQDSLINCRHMMLRDGVQDTLGRLVYCSLLAWVDLFLAQLNQSMGGVEDLRTAVFYRTEILGLVQHIHSSGAHPQLGIVCAMYYCTAQYELGDALGSSELKNGAIQGFSKIMKCTEDAAVAQVCFLLCLDHAFLGRFDKSLRWIREANHVRKKNLSDWNSCKFYFLDFEATLLMKLDKFSEALEPLQETRQTSQYGRDRNFPRKVHEMLLECYTRMSRRAADNQDVQRAEEYEALTREQQSLILSFQPEVILHPCQVLFPNIAFTHPLMMTKASPLGISVRCHESHDDQSSLIKRKYIGVAMEFSQRLGLTEARWTVQSVHLCKFPPFIAETLRKHFDAEEYARKRHDWDTAIFSSEQAREIVKLAKGLVDAETHRWLLAWVDLPLAGLYHYRERHFQKALNIWKEIQDCAALKLAASRLTWELSWKDCQIPFAALKYELSCASTYVQGKYEIIQKWARAQGTDEGTAERDLCFWLYFGYHLYENFGEALKWLLITKGLREDNIDCQQKRGTRVDYFCCDYDYNRCEVELFTKLGMPEKAASALGSLQQSKHVQQDGIVHDDYELFDENLREQLPSATPTPTSTSTPTPTGCIALKMTNSDRIKKLAQSPAGLEHHLHKLPFPIQMAFRKHAWIGRVYNLERADWESAIFQYEWCHELLDIVFRLCVGVGELRDTYNWLMMWVAVSLADLYEYKAKKYREALDLRMLMFNLMAPIEGSDNKSRIQIRGTRILPDVYAAAYLCAVSDYPSSSDLKNKVVASARVVSMPEVENDWGVEYLIMRLLMKHFVITYENCEGALAFLRRAMQRLDQRFQEPASKLTKEYVAFLSYEVYCLRDLRRPDDAKTVLENYWRSTGKSKPELPGTVQGLLWLLSSGDTIAGTINHDFDRVIHTLHYIQRDLHELIMPSGESPEQNVLWSPLCQLELDHTERAISCHEEFLKLVEEKAKQQELVIIIQSRFIANARIAICYMSLFYRNTVSWATQRMKAHDCNLLRAEEYFKKCLHQVTSEPGQMVLMSHSALVASVLLFLMSVYYQAWIRFDEHLIFCATTLEKKLAYHEDNVAVQAEQLEARRTQAIDAFCDEIKDTFELVQQLQIQKYGQKLVMHHIRSLHTVATKEYSEGWIEWLEDYKYVYSFLQLYFAKRGYWIRNYLIFRRCEEPDVNLAKRLIFTEREADVSLWNAFLFSEGERTRVMLYQHEMHRRKSFGLSVQQWLLDAHENNALRYIKEGYGALLTRESTVFVQYSPIYSTGTAHCWCYFIYVLMIDQDHGCKLFVETTRHLDHDEVIAQFAIEKRKGPTPKKRLKDLHDYLQYKTEHPDHKVICDDKKNRRLKKTSTITDDKLMNKYLEFLYNALIGPIAEHLGKMKRGDKLVLAPSELLTQVPFAALINPKTHKRLIESHAISMAPSLRVLQMCSERAQDLRRRSGDGRASILALGDPTYDCGECIGNNRRRLKATAKEVNHIASVFGETAVVTLTGKNATTKQLLRWASNPSPESQSRLAIVHIGAHGVIGKDESYKNNHLQLACDASHETASNNASPNASTSALDHPASQSSTSSTRTGNEDDEQRDKDTFDSETEDDTTCFGMSAIFSRMLTTSSSIIDTGAVKPSGGGFEGCKRSGGPRAFTHDLTEEAIDSSEREWNVEMLVLSACQTSAGRITSEGVLSLARAFMAAGVPCVVASMWKVEDEATCALMADFYDGLRAGKDVASALQSASLCSMQRHGHDAVQYWAPFNVWGVPSLRIPEYLQQQRDVEISQKLEIL